MNKQLWLELNEAAQVARLANLTAEHVANAFLANYLAALVLMRLHDVDTAQLLRDANGAKMNGFKATMSDPNFWGYAAMFPRDKYVTAKLGKTEADKLYDLAAKWIPEQTAQKVMALLQSPPDLVNWEQAYFMLALLRERFSVNSTYLNRAAPLLRTWHLRSPVERLLALSNAFQYLLQSDPRSRLLPRLRELNQGELMHAASTGTGLRGFFRMYEDDGGAVAGPAVATGTSAASVGTTNGAVTNAIVTPPSYQTATDRESPVGSKLTKDSGDLLGKLYRKKLGGKAMKHSRFAKLKAVQKADSKIVRKKKRNYLPRPFKDPELNDVLGDYSNVRAA